MEGETVVIKMHDDEYRFHSETDEDFIRWTRMCVEGYNAEYLKYSKGNSSAEFSNNRERIGTQLIFAEVAGKKLDIKDFLEARIDNEIKFAQELFHNELKPYLEPKV